MTTSLRSVRMWLLLSLALPKANPDREVLIALAADAFLEAWRLERARRPKTTSIGAVAEA
jgi:hypothetical protein